MKRILWIFIPVMLTFTGIDANAQRWKLRRYEVDFGLSAVPFYGDIGLANRPFANAFNGLRPSLGVTPRFFIRQNMAVSLDLSYLMFGGQDKEGESHSRVYSFNANVFQHYARMEYYLVGTGRQRGSGIYNRRGMINNYNRLIVYLYAGAGGILSSAIVTDEEGNEPLDNTGYYPGMQYGLGFPVGGGFKMNLDPRWSIGLEMGYHFTTTDLLDGYSKEEFSNYNDTYYLVTFKAVYRIRNDRNGRPVFNKYYR